MTVLTSDDIIKQYNSIIADYISKGYVISPFTNYGSYTNTRSYTDLVKLNDKNKHIIRVWLIEDYISTGITGHSFNDTYKIVVSKHESFYAVDDWNFIGRINIQPNSYSINQGLVYSKTYYKYKVCNGKIICTDNLEEVCKFIKLSEERWSNKEKSKYSSRDIPIEKLPNSFIDSVMKRINSNNGFKRAKANCIVKVTLGKSVFGKLSADVYYNYNNKSSIINLSNH